MLKKAKRQRKNALLQNMTGEPGGYGMDGHHYCSLTPCRVKDKEKDRNNNLDGLSADSEDLGAALRTDALGRRLSVLQLDLLRIRNLYLFLALYAVSFHFKNLRVFLFYYCTAHI
jgi:hypothetical protein